MLNYSSEIGVHIQEKVVSYNCADSETSITLEVSPESLKKLNLSVN